MRPCRLSRAGCVSAVALWLLATPAVAAPRLDDSFGDGGIARALFKGQRQELFGTLRPVRQADGKLLVGSQPDPDHGLAQEFVLARFTRAGVLDRTFGRRGRLDMRFRSQFRPLTVVAQRTRILLVGTVGGYAYFYAQPSRLGVVRLLPDGSPDRSFGPDGFMVWDPPGHPADAWTMPQSVLRQPDGRLLVVATVEGPSPRSPGGSRQLVLVRLQPDGSLDQSFGQGGFAELDLDGGYLGPWALLADGRLATVVSRPDESTFGTTTAWWLITFAPDGSSTGPLSPPRSVKLGVDDLGQLIDLVPTRDGGLLMIGETAVRRIRPNGSLDATYGRQCAQPLLRARSRGGAATPDGRVFVTSWKLLIHARPRRFDSWLVPRDAAGCVAATPLRLRGLLAGPPLSLPGRSAVIGASYYTLPDFDTGLALIKIRR